MDIGRGLLAGALNELARLSANTGEFFHNIAGDVNAIPLIRGLASWFQGIGFFFDELSWNFIVLRDSLLRIYDKALEILDWDTIWSLIEANLPDISVIADWIANAFEYVTGLINDFWTATSTTVQSWIAIAKQEVTSYVDFIKVGVDNLWSQWDDFRTLTLPTLVDAITVDNLIRTWFREYEPFWEGWQHVYQAFRDFFDDPEAWLYRRIDNMLERFW